MDTTAQRLRGTDASHISHHLSENINSEGYDRYGLRFPLPHGRENDQQTKLRENMDRERISHLMEMMTNPDLNRANFGVLAERLTRLSLMYSGLTFLDHNYHTRYGEIDLIFLEDDTIVFVEVKARRNTQFGSPAEAVTLKKQQKIRKTALEWLRNKPEGIPANARIRFDVAAIEVHGSHVQCALIPGAF
jgi:putative endonuclease